MMNYKDTLLMPQTAFDMRANLVQKEPNIQARWAEKNLYQAMRDQHADREPFVLHDGPPYANGNIHIGHALNKILKDVVVRSHHMLGHRVDFIPGWDTHGLPIETAISKLGHNRKDMSVSAFRTLCAEYAKDQIQKQRIDFKALGSVGAYDEAYATLDPHFEAAQIDIFGMMALQGLIYKGLKPVYWSPSSESALAEAEIEYHPKKDPSIYVRFSVVDGKDVLQVGDGVVIWTTTPWTLPANLAISVHPNLTYVRVQTSQGVLVVSKRLLNALMSLIHETDYNVLSEFKGSAMEFVQTKHPMYDRSSLVIVGEHVSDEDGTGCVHTAPGHGEEDFIVGMKYGLEAFCPVDERGCMTAEAGDFLTGVYVEKANEIIIERLKTLNALLAEVIIDHPYAHDWRTKKPVIFRATDQWFASIERIRSQLLDAIDGVRWVPEWGKVRMYNMIKDRGDWCISRQRAWGVPIPIFYTEANTAVMDAEVFKHISDLVRKHGSNIWFEKAAKDLLPKGYSHPDSPKGQFRKETDIMDVWFDSGSSHTGVILERGGNLPVDVYLEGSDQYRGWFNSSLIVSVAAHGYAPYKTVVSHGFVLDGKGEKMSKSLGNVVEPNKVVKEYGADILRLWACSIDISSDVRISDELLKQVIDNYKKLRNTFRFLLGNLDQFTASDRCELSTLPAVDLDILHRLNRLIDGAHQSYKDFDFKSLISAVSAFMSQDLSAYYLDFTKDILYIEARHSERRRQVQTVLDVMLESLMRLLAPVLVHTMEEVNDHAHPGAESIHLQTFPQRLSLPAIDEAAFKELFKLREEVFKALEEARANKVIGKSLEARVQIGASVEERDRFTQLVPRLDQWLMVSKLDWVDSNQGRVQVEPAQGQTCPRCWNVTSTDHAEGLCARCVAVVHG
jgi:isoleucyl-tRNA synthetase